MRALRKLDQKLYRWHQQLVARITPQPRPDQPLFTRRLLDRQHRWWVENEEHPSKLLKPKLGGQNFVRSLGYPLPEVYAVLPRITALPPLDQLPSRFVLKPENDHSVNNVFLMDNGTCLLLNKRLTREDIIAKVGPANQSAFMIEEMLMHHDGRHHIANDLKFYAFGGRIAYIVMIERNSAKRTELNRYWYLTEDWRPLPINATMTLRPERGIPPMPDCYPEALAIARDIGRRLKAFCRIDMYATGRGPVFGEFTNFPSAGKNVSRKADIWLGAMWKGANGCEDLPVDVGTAAGVMERAS